MLRTIYLLPTSDAYNAGTRYSGTGSSHLDRWPNSSPHGGSPLKTLWEVWRDATYDDLHETVAPYCSEATQGVCSYSKLALARQFGAKTTGLVTVEPPPTLSLFRRVKLHCWMDYFGHGGNSWFFPGFPPGHPHGPRAKFAMRARDSSAILQLGSFFEVGYSGSTGTPVGDRYCNGNQPSCGTGYDGPIHMEHEMLSHPEGGVFSLEDMLSLQVGIYAEIAAPGWDNSMSFARFRHFHFYVEVDVEDLGGYVVNVRNASSLELRLKRRARNRVTGRVPMDRAVGDVGSRAYLIHAKGPSVLPGGWGRRRLERRAGLVLKRRRYPETFEVEDEFFDLLPYACLAWAAYRIDGPWSPELQGLALVDKGAGYTHTRDQDAWSPRPGDGALMRLLEDSPNVSFHGLAAQGGGDVELVLRNYDMTLAGWSTVGSSGDFSVIQDMAVALVEEQGYRSSAKLSYGAGGGMGGRSRSLGTLPRASGEIVHLRAVVKNSIIQDPVTQKAEVYLSRSGGGLPSTEYWDDTARQWTTTPTYAAIPSSEPFGEVVMDAIPVDAAGATSDPTYTIAIGRFSSNLLNVVVHAGILNVQRGGAAFGKSYGARSPLVTLDAQLVRAADTHRMANSATPSAEIWSYTRGVAMVEVRPYWRAAAIPQNDVLPLLHARHGAGSYDALQFIAKDSPTNDVVRFERAVSGQPTFQLDCAITGVELTRAHILRAWGRWLGSEGWKEFGPFSVEVGYAVFLEATGALLAQASTIGRLTYEGDVATRDWVAIGSDESSRYADASIRTWETRRNPISGLEATWRL